MPLGQNLLEFICRVLEKCGWRQKVDEHNTTPSPPKKKERKKRKDLEVKEQLPSSFYFIVGLKNIRINYVLRAMIS